MFNKILIHKIIISN